MSTVVARIYTYINPSSGCLGKRIIYAAGRGDRGGGRGGRFNGRGRGIGRGGRGGRGRGGHDQGGCGEFSGAHEIGIDISYVTCYFEDPEWAAILNKTRKRTTEEPIHTKSPENKKRETKNSISSEKDDDNRLIYHIITGVQNTSRHEYGLEGGVIRFTTNRSRTKMSAANIISSSEIRNEPEELGVVTCNHLGKHVTRY